MPNLLIQHQLQGIAQKRLAYVVRILNEHPLKPEGFTLTLHESIVVNHTIGYGITRGDWRIPAQKSFFSKNEKIHYSFGSYQHNDQLCYSVEKYPQHKRPLLIEKTFQYDLFETLFFHLSRYEEIFANVEDQHKHGWLKEEAHFLVRNQLHQIPVVDQLVKAFFEIINGKPIQRPTTFALSHDLDFLGRFTPATKFWQSIAASLFRRYDLGAFGRSVNYYINMLLGHKRDPYNYFPTLLRPETFWQHKTLYLMAGGETAYDNHYQLTDTRLDEIINLAQQRGYDIGLHPSYNAGWKATLYRDEWEKLSERIGQPIKHNRQHWLRMDWQQTPYLWEKLGIAVDSTLGYSQHLGFRCGTGFSYHLYDFKHEKAFEFVERPFAFMDSAAVHVALREGKDLEELMQDFLERIPGETELLFNFHNSSFDPLTERGKVLRKFYEGKVV